MFRRRSEGANEDCKIPASRYHFASVPTVKTSARHRTMSAAWQCTELCARSLSSKFAWPYVVLRDRCWDALSSALVGMHRVRFLCNSRGRLLVKLLAFESLTGRWNRVRNVASLVCCGIHNSEDLSELLVKQRWICTRGARTSSIPFLSSLAEVMSGECTPLVVIVT